MDLSRILTANIDGRTQNTRYRQAEFHRLQSTLVEHLAEIQDAIRADSGHTQQEIRAEVVLALQELRTHYTSLSLTKDLEVEYRIAQGRDNVDGWRGAGIVYIVPCVHTLFFSVISALTAALAAGNCIVLEVKWIHCCVYEVKLKHAIYSFPKLCWLCLLFYVEFYQMRWIMTLLPLQPNGPIARS